uniref:Trafficking protein particle complex subunit 8 n=1 Tax=Angiostrongylus cantonensis TaxID=6313 RepID=A0A0K0D000_ANGCA
MENPLVALVASSAAQLRVRDCGFSSISRLLQPFATHSVINANITVNFNDLSSEGHLLSLSVLPHVLYEMLCVCIIILNDALDRFSSPVDQETFRTYLACIFVVSCSEDNPLAELSRLIQVQHAQQHSSGESKSLTPSHCAPPKWITPNTLKHYLLLYDQSVIHRSLALFNEMCSVYGVDSCQILPIGKGTAVDGLSEMCCDAEELDAVLNAGLRRALQHATASAIVQHTLEREPSAFACKNCTVQYDWDFSLFQVPHVERLMRTLFEQLAARRGLIGKSLTSGMKKWFGGGSGANLPIFSLPPECVEMQSRRLADLAFMFGLFRFAYSQYRSVRKDFEHCQAWLHYAAASVRLVYSVLPNTSMFFINWPHVSVSLYHKCTSIMRCALNAASVLSSMALFKEAASLISSDIDMCVAVLQAHASNYFERASMTRKAAFYRVLAGNRFMKAGLKQNALGVLSLWIRVISFVLSYFRMLSTDAQETRVFYGERPQPDDVPLTSNISWLDMERAAFHALVGASSVFRPTHLVSDNETDNQRVRSTPPEERFRVEVNLRNPLKTSLTVQSVTLGITDVQMREGIMLWVRPSCHLSGFRVGSILLQIVGSNQASVSGFLPFKIRGKRLNTNPRQMKSVVYALDERLRVSVAQRRWPLLDFNIVRKNQSEFYCGQAVVLSIDVENIGEELVTGFYIGTNAVDCVSARLLDERGNWLVLNNFLRYDAFYLGSILLPGN